MNRPISRKGVEDSLMTMQNISYERIIYRFKVILLGNVSVGKTSICTQFLETKFEGEYTCTVSVDFKIKSLQVDENTTADLQIWDTCGQEVYKTITRQYYRDSNGKK